MSRGLVRRLLPKTLALFLVWLLVSGQVTPYYLILGFLCAFAVAWVDLRRSPAPRKPFPWGRFVLYLPWLLSRMIWSALHVTRVILHPRLPIAPHLLQYSPRLRDHAALTLLGNSITLTPGTVTVELSDHTLVVHAIDRVSAVDLTSKTLEERVAHVFEAREQGSR